MDKPTRIHEDDSINVYWYADRSRKEKQCVMKSWLLISLGA